MAQLRICSGGLKLSPIARPSVRYILCPGYNFLWCRQGWYNAYFIWSMGLYDDLTIRRVDTLTKLIGQYLYFANIIDH